MHNPASVLENDTHKLLWDFDIQMDHLVSARRLDLIIPPTTDHRIKLKEYEKKDNYLDIAREVKKNYGFWLARLVQ